MLIMAERLLCWQGGQGSAHWCQHTAPSARLGVPEVSSDEKKEQHVLAYIKVSCGAGW